MSNVPDSTTRGVNNAIHSMRNAAATPSVAFRPTATVGHGSTGGNRQTRRRSEARVSAGRRNSRARSDVIVRAVQLNGTWPTGSLMCGMGMSVNPSN